MAKTWDLSRILRGKAVVTLLATAAALVAGVHAFAPPVASAELTDCTTEPQGCDGGSGGGGDGGSSTGDSSTGTGGGSTGLGGTSGSSGTTWGDVDPANEDFSDPFKPDPAIQRELEGTQPMLRSLDPRYIDRLLRLNLIDPRVVDIPDNPGDLSVLTGDCYKLSSTIGTLDDKVDSLRSLVDLTYGDPGGKGIQKTWERVRDRRDDRGVEYRALSCGSVLSLDGRD